MKTIRTSASGLVALAVLLLAIGCRQPASPGPKGGEGPSAEKGGKEDHAHGTGPHGGAVADWGGGKMHIEFTVDHDKQEATVYVLGSDMKTPVPIKAKDGEISASITGVKDKGTF